MARCDALTGLFNVRELHRTLTEEIARSFATRGVELWAFRERQGKVACLNQVVPQLQSEIVVMSDANSMYAPDSLRKLVRHFADEHVGCVCGELQYLNPRDLPAGKGENLYWRFEGLIKRVESSLGSLLGANGAMYAYRPRDFRPVDPLMFCDDVIPVRIALGGLLTLYDSEARCTEEAADVTVEMRRRRRHASFGLRSMILLCREAARKGRVLILYQCVSHRILRWVGGLALLGCAVSAPFLPPPWAPIALGAQAAFYGTAALGFLAFRAGARSGPLYLPCYFLVITAAGLIGLGAFLLRTDRPHWEPRQ
jgi:cellulose synthase/poly-beta-1,6-N-acetylglucosamine synthase-like glycosyltransferase